MIFIPLKGRALAVRIGASSRSQRRRPPSSTVEHSSLDRLRNPFTLTDYFLVASGAAGAGAVAAGAAGAGAGASAGFSALGAGFGSSFLLQPIPTIAKLIIITIAMKRKTHFFMFLHLLSEQNGNPFLVLAPRKRDVLLRKDRLLGLPFLIISVQQVFS